MKRVCGEQRKQNMRNGYSKVMVIAIMLLSLLFVSNLEPKETEQKVEELESNKSVAATEKYYNALAMDGIEAREGRYGYAEGDNYWFDFYSYTDYNFYKGSWTDGSGNPYVKVAFRVDTRYGYEEDCVGVSKLVVDVPSQLTVVKSSMSISSSSISVAYSNDNRKLTFTFNKGLGYRVLYINYVCVVDKSKLPSTIINGSKQLYTVGTDASKSTYGCAKLTTPDGTSSLTSSPGLDFYVNTSSQRRIIYPDLSYTWGSNLFWYTAGGVYIYYDGLSYQSDGDMVFYIRTAIDLTETLYPNHGQNINLNVNIPDVYDFMSGSVDVSSSAISYSNTARQVKFVINGNNIENKMYYMTFRIRLNFDKVPKTYFANEDYAELPMIGTTYNMITNPEQIGLYGSWGDYGELELEQHTAEMRVRSNLTLYPKGGTIHSGNVEYYRYGHTTTFTTDITKTGYTFGGWYSSSDDNRYTGVGPAGRYSKSFYAAWNSQSYSVKLEPQGGTIKSGNVTSYTYGRGATLPTESQMERTGYAFKGWYTNAAGTGSRVYSIGTQETGNKTFYAKWEQVVYSVTLDPKGGTINSGNVTQYTYGVGATLPTNVTKHGYDFMGWYENESYTGSPVTKITASQTGNKKYYAKWQASVYRVKLHPNGGNFVPGTEITSYTYGVGAKLPNALIIRREGYEFGGWYDNPGFNNSPVTKIPPTDTGNKEYWAKWISFDIVTEDKLTRVYGLNDDDKVFKSNGVEFKVNTTSTSNIKAYLGYNTSKTEAPATGEVTANAGRNAVIPLTKEMGESVVGDKTDKEVYIKLVAECKQFDGDNWVYYNVYVHKMTTLRFVASYEEW